MLASALGDLCDCHFKRISQTSVRISVPCWAIATLEHAYRYGRRAHWPRVGHVRINAHAGLCAARKHMCMFKRAGGSAVAQVLDQLILFTINNRTQQRMVTLMISDTGSAQKQQFNANSIRRRRGNVVERSEETSLLFELSLLPARQLAPEQEAAASCVSSSKRSPQRRANHAARSMANTFWKSPSDK